MAAVTTDGASSTVTSVAIGDACYPPLLREIADPPDALYVRGDPQVLLQPHVAIVGSRRASSAGLRLASEIAAELGRAGLNVCSGLAMGIDGEAHRGTLSAGAKTTAVMATGIDTVYPKRHRSLATEIATQGCLITEFAPDMPALRGNFPQRNRIISGMSMGVVVVEAALASGSLITARTAAEQNREVFALPWSPLHVGGAGCLQLLRDGAKMVQCVDDILEELGSLYALARATEEGVAASPPPGGGQHAGDRLLALISVEETTLDSLIAHTGKPVAEILAALTRLEIAGAIARTASGYIRT